MSAARLEHRISAIAELRTYHLRSPGKPGIGRSPRCHPSRRPRYARAPQDEVEFLRCHNVKQPSVRFFFPLH